MTSMKSLTFNAEGSKVRRMAGMAVAALLVVLTVLGGSCGKGNSLPPLNIDQAHLDEITTGSVASGASFTVPRNTVVTSSSVSNHDVILRVADLTPVVGTSFDGNIFGGASFIPLDAQFSNQVALEVPAGNATGVVNVYYNRPAMTAGAQTSQTSWSLWGTAAVEGGIVEITTTLFGHYLVGELNEVLIPGTPTGLMASDGLFTDKVRLIWNQVDSATGYQIFRDSQIAPVATVGEVGTWDDVYDPHNQGGGQTLSIKLPAVADTAVHNYWVKAVNQHGTSGFSNIDSGFVALHGQGGGSTL